MNSDELSHAVCVPCSVRQSSYISGASCVGAQGGTDPTKGPPGGTPTASVPANGHAAPAGEHAATTTAAEGGPKGVKEGTARRGVAPGSFLDLLMRATDRTTGRGFTDTEIANQARTRAMLVLMKREESWVLRNFWTCTE